MNRKWSSFSNIKFKWNISHKIMCKIFVGRMFTQFVVLTVVHVWSFFFAQSQLKTIDINCGEFFSHSQLKTIKQYILNVLYKINFEGRVFSFVFIIVSSLWLCKAKVWKKDPGGNSNTGGDNCTCCPDDSSRLNTCACSSDRQCPELCLAWDTDRQSQNCVWREIQTDSP